MAVPEFKNFPDPLTKELVKIKCYDSIRSSFYGKSTYKDKVRFSLDLTERYGLLPTESMVKSSKDEAKALSAKCTGNQFFAKGDYLHALENYNKSLCLSEKGSENMGLTYANRSAVYFKTGYYETCLVNIELALENGYPEKMKAKLLKRIEDCLTAINNGQGKKMEPEEVEVKLSYKPHSKIPQIVEGIELAKNEKFGNHYVAKKNFNPGDVLMIEKPIIETLEAKQVYLYCFYCLKSNLLNLLPCEESTYAMFCSKKCYDEAMEKYFKYEGPILDAVYKLLQEKSVVIRLVIKLVTIFGNLDDLKEAFDRLTLNNFDPITFDFKNATEKDWLLAFCSFPTYENLRVTEKLFKYSNWSAYSFFLMKNFTGVGRLFKTEEHENLLMKIMYRLNLVVSVYDKFMDSLYPKQKEFLQTKGNRLSIVTNLLNHSCAPNAYCTGEDKGIVVAIRPIKAGEQVFMSYGPDHRVHPLSQRKLLLENYFYLDCTCEACENNFPLMGQLKVNVTRELQQSYALLPLLDVFTVTNRKVVVDAFKKYSAFLKKYDKYYPDAMTNFVLSKQRDCIVMLYLNKPLELTF